MLKNHAICIGAQKAGTTWLFRCLQESPEICEFSGKEMHFFSDQKKFDSLEFYSAYFSNCKSGQVTFEASTSYLSAADSAKRISEYIPNSKIILIHRDPVERTHSHILHYISKGIIQNNTPLEEILKKYPECIENSLYGKHLENYLKYFPSKNIFVASYIDIIKQPQVLFDDICNFLEIKKYTPLVVRTKYHSSEARSNPLYFIVTKNYLRLKKNAGGRLFITALKFLGINNLYIDKMLRKTSRKKPLLSENDRLALEEIFASDSRKYDTLIKEKIESRIS